MCEIHNNRGCGHRSSCILLYYLYTTEWRQFGHTSSLLLPVVRKYVGHPRLAGLTVKGCLNEVANAGAAEKS